MKRVLMIKMSSMGDVLHSLPAVTEAVQHNPELRFDWVVEEGFEQIPAWHPAVDRVLVTATRKWRKNWHASGTERKAFIAGLKEREYDLVIDAQGLFKSALIARLANGPRCGLSFFSARERLASIFYNKRFHVPAGHAVKRVRALLSQSLGYTLGDHTGDYGINTITSLTAKASEGTSKALLFLHGTTWDSKCWPEHNWIELAKRANEAGYKIWLPWWTEQEHARCKRIAASCEGVRMRVEILQRGDLETMARHIRSASAVIAVDTGLGHMAAAFSVPCLSIYGATDPARTGTWGTNQTHVRAKYRCSPCLARKCKLLDRTTTVPPCYDSCSAEEVWRVLSEMLGDSSPDSAM